MLLYKGSNIPGNVRVSHLGVDWDSQGQETFLAPFLDKQYWTIIVTQNAQTTIPPNHHKVLGLSYNKIKWWAMYIQIYYEIPNSDYSIFEAEIVSASEWF